MEINETYRDPSTLAENGLRYFAKDGKHVVVHYMTAGESDYPNVYRFDNIESARNQWKTLRAHLTRIGYTERSK